MGIFFVLASYTGLKEPLFARARDQGDYWHDVAISTNISSNETVNRVKLLLVCWLATVFVSSSSLSNEKSGLKYKYFPM